MGISVGIDLVSVEAVAESIAEHSDRYLTRIYSDGELAACRDRDGAPDPQRLAARFAAKEALLKVLRTGVDEPIPWREISVRSARFEAPVFELAGRAEAAAHRRGVRDLALSFTHEGPFAAAVVTAEIEEAR